MAQTIGNPLSWLTNRAENTTSHLSSVTDELGSQKTTAFPEIQEIDLDDIRDALRLGVNDFKTFRSDVIFLCFLYPIIGACLVWMIVQSSLLPLIFPVISGFALIGPLAAVGLYEMSRRREQGLETNWLALADVWRSPAFGAVFVLGLFHIALFVVWILAANMLYALTLGPDTPASISAFLQDTIMTQVGWVMAILGTIIGAIFAFTVLAVSIVSFPLLLDRHVGLPIAVITSVRVAVKNPRTVATWGLIVAISLALGSLPMLLGLVFVMPILGHATWHLYRKAVVS